LLIPKQFIQITPTYTANHKTVSDARKTN